MIRLVFAAVPLLWLAGCGYPGDPLPPAANIPVAVQDLTAVQRGDRILVAFTAPQKTTEDLVLRTTPTLELRIGPDFPDAPVFAVTTDPETHRSQAEVPSAQFTGRTVTVAVRAAGPRNKWSAWSNQVRVDVVPPLPVPNPVRATGVVEGVQLEWPGQASPATAWQVFRKAPKDPEPQKLALTEQPRYLDTATSYGEIYTYFVQTVHKGSEGVESESDVSAPVSITPVDIFPPGVPTNLSAITGINSIELTWARVTDADVKGYRVYRSQEGGAFQQVAEVSTPSYSDHKVEAGKRYRYQVSALDQAGNESAKSDPIEAAAP